MYDRESIFAWAAYRGFREFEGWQAADLQGPMLSLICLDGRVGPVLRTRIGLDLGRGCTLSGDLVEVEGDDIFRCFSLDPLFLFRPVTPVVW